MRMNRSKGAAALLSALVFPGVGQWYLHRRRLALLFAVPALVAGYVYLNFALDEANALAGQVLAGSVPLDPAALAAQAGGAADLAGRHAERLGVRGVLGGQRAGGAAGETSAWARGAHPTSE
jgi:hypothetical protein